MSNTNENKTENGGKLIFCDGQEMLISSGITEISKDIYTGTNDVSEIAMIRAIPKMYLIRFLVFMDNSFLWGWQTCGHSYSSRLGWPPFGFHC